MLLNTVLDRPLAPEARISLGPIARCQAPLAWAAYDMAPLTTPSASTNNSSGDDPQKVIVGVGAYRDNLGKPFSLCQKLNRNDG
jgi:hypothetical protein